MFSRLFALLVVAVVVGTSIVPSLGAPAAPQAAAAKPPGDLSVGAILRLGTTTLRHAGIVQRVVSRKTARPWQPSAEQRSSCGISPLGSGGPPFMLSSGSASSTTSHRSRCRPMVNSWPSPLRFAASVVDEISRKGRASVKPVPFLGRVSAPGEWPSTECAVRLLPGPR